MVDETYAALQAQAIARLIEILGADEPRSAEVSILMQAASGLDRSSLIMRGDDPVPQFVRDRFTAMVDERINHKPVYRIVGSREFHGLDLALSAQTLEPRDDTEALIDLVLSHAPDREKPYRFADLGTGTGAIALALLSELPKAECLATDISQGALDTALQNARRCELEGRFDTVCGSWTEPLFGSFDFIVSNPPYIATSIVEGLAREVLDHDPRRALDGGNDGLDAYQALFATCGGSLKKGGFLAVEIGFDQRQSVCALAERNGWQLQGAQQDLGQRDRALLFTVSDAKL